MDFKVAGTERGITALQMDIKITSITEEIMRIALEQARDGRAHILGEMAKALTGARDEVSENAPRITTISIPKDKIREVIGSGGKVIREITETTGAKIDIDDDGTIKVAAVDADASKAAIDWIRGIVAEPELGAIYNGKVVKVVDFGAFVNFLGAKDGLVHISELAQQRVGKTSRRRQAGRPGQGQGAGLRRPRQGQAQMRQVDQATGEDLGTPAPSRAAGAGAGARGVTAGAQSPAIIPITGLNLPSVIGHRGAAARAPENTLAGFRVAKSLGCMLGRVRRALDRRQRARGLPRRPARADDQRTRRDLQAAARSDPKARCRGWFDARFAGERVPTLDETLTPLPRA